MPNIAEYLSELNKQRTKLAENLTAMGVQATTTEKLNTLVPKVLQIQQSGDGTVKEAVLLDTNTFTSKQETISAYGETVYIYESSSDTTLQKYDDVIEKWGGTSVTNNFVGDASAKYGKTKPLYRHLSPSIIKHCQIGVESPFKLVEIRKSASFRCSQKSQILRNLVEIW